MRTIGERIKDRREQLKMSQDELAQKLGYKSRSSINKIELGERNLTQSKIKAISDALETTPAYIMGWEDKELSAELTPIYPHDNTIVLNDEEMELFKKYNNLDEESKRQLVLMLAFLSEQSRKK